MNAALPTVMPILATPLGLAAIPDAEQLNPALREVFAQRAAADRRAPQNPLRFSSSDDLMQWPEPPVQRLGGGVVDAVCSLVGSVSDISGAQLRSCRLETRRWVTGVRTHGAVTPGTYPLTASLAVYRAAR